MRTRRLQFMRPDEILEAKRERSVVYLPMGPLEWHSYHMPFGTDPLQAEMTAAAAAELAGGVVMPTLYFGTETKTSPEVLEYIGLEDTGQYIVGIDLPKNTVKSFYSREEVFAVILSEEIRLCINQGYKLIVLVNGHGSAGQLAVIERFSKEFSNETGSKVIHYTTIESLEEAWPDLSHAGKVETAIQRYYDDSNVDLNMLPPKPEKLKYADFAIIDMEAFEGKPTADKAVLADPRDTTVEMGGKYISQYSKSLAKMVEEAYEGLQQKG